MSTFTFAAVPDDETGLESGLLRVVLDVASKVLQLRLAAHNVIKRLPLPEAASSMEKLIDVV